MTDPGGLADLSKQLTALKEVPTLIVATKHDDVPARQMTMVSLVPSPAEEAVRTSF